jgi:hypothetical protein
MMLPRTRRASDPFRLTLVLLGRCFAWREALSSVRPWILLHWQWKLLWAPKIQNRHARWCPEADTPAGGSISFEIKGQACETQAEVPQSGWRAAGGESAFDGPLGRWRFEGERLDPPNLLDPLDTPSRPW